MFSRNFQFHRRDPNSSGSDWKENWNRKNRIDIQIAFWSPPNSDFVSNSWTYYPGRKFSRLGSSRSPTRCVHPRIQIGWKRSNFCISSIQNWIYLLKCTVRGGLTLTWIKMPKSVPPIETSKTFSFDFTSWSDSKINKQRQKMGFPSCPRSTEGTVLGYYLTSVQTVRSAMTGPQIQEQNQGQANFFKPRTESLKI